MRLIKLSEGFTRESPGRVEARPKGGRAAALLSGLFFIVIATAEAGSATWNLNPGNSDWDRTTNWSPATVPYGETDVATFGVSNTTNVTVGDAPNGIDATNMVGEIAFPSGASAYTITMTPVFDVVFPTGLVFYGVGITNNSGVVQNLVAANSGGLKAAAQIIFFNSASAGNDVFITNEGGASPNGDGVGGGYTHFSETATAGNATVISNGGLVRGTIGGACSLLSSSNAENATFISDPGQVSEAGAAYSLIQTLGNIGTSTFIGRAAEISGAEGGWIEWDYGTAAGANFILNGGTVPNAQGGQVYVYGGSGYATFTGYGGQGRGSEGGLIDLFDLPGSDKTVVIANGGTNRGLGATILIEGHASPSEGQFRIYGNGSLDLRKAKSPGPVIGSLEGDGLVSLASNGLSIGGNNLSTTFSGTIEDTGPLTKVGTGTLTLSGSNSYTGGTTVSAGTLVVSNLSGSATGTSAVSVSAGTLGGSGTISSSVTIGTGSGAGAFLAPAHGGDKQLTLTIQGGLTLNSDSTYTYTFKAKRNRSKTDKVVANGVTINSGTSFDLSGTTQGTLTEGTVLTVVKNTAASPISGTFSNLPDGAIVSVNGNNLQADYQGGDGNDLTLTVVP